MCVYTPVSLCFRFGAFDSAMSWAVGERALQHRFHVPFLCAFEKLCYEMSEVLFEHASFECILETSSRRNPGRFSDKS